MQRKENNVKAIELIALLSTLDPDAEIKAYISPKYGDSYVADSSEVEKCVTEDYQGNASIDVVLYTMNMGDKVAGDTYSLTTPDDQVKSWADEEEEEEEYAEAMNVGMLIDKLKQFEERLLVYMSKYEYFGNVASVHYVNEVDNPVSGKTCVLLQDNQSRFDAGYSTLESKMTVADLIRELNKFGSETEVMIKPRNGAKNFGNVNAVEKSSYSSWGIEVSCVMLVDNY